MLKPLLLATAALCLFSAEASARQVYRQPYQHHAYQHHVYRHHAYQRPTYQRFADQRPVYRYRHGRVRSVMSTQVAGAMTEQPRIAPELSDSFITAPRSFAHAYRQHRYEHPVDQGSAYQTSAGQRPLSYRRYARAWCGTYLSAYLGKSDRRLALAREWAKEGSNAGGPGVGVVVVWPHHVGIITGQAPDGQWIVHSGNDGGGVRTRARSLRGAIAFRRV